jgi:hypothetical protein
MKPTKKYPGQILFGAGVSFVGAFLVSYSVIGMSSLLGFLGIGIGMVGFCFLVVGLINLKDGR